jgi:hypothetical protein
MAEQLSRRPGLPTDVGCLVLARSAVVSTVSPTRVAANPDVLARAGSAADAEAAQ